MCWIVGGERPAWARSSAGGEYGLQNMWLTGFDSRRTGGSTKVLYTKCGVKLAEGKTAFWIVGAVLVLMALGMITDFIKPSGTSSTPSSNNEAVMKAQREAEAFKAMTTAEHLKAVALDQITTPQQATLAQRHLEAIFVQCSRVQTSPRLEQSRSK